jgi:small subunit ribosomal protein S17
MTDKQTTSRKKSATTSKTTISTKADSKKPVAVKSGVVVSDKMDKTVVVEIVSLKTHQKYRKKYRETTRFKIHDEENKARVGDKITFRSCRPISRHKKWELVEIVS